MNNADPGKESGVFSFEFKRAIVGGLSLACFLLAGLIYVANPDWNNVLLAGAIRIGVVLFATWLALPQLRSLLAKVPNIVPPIALVLMMFCAARPNLSRIVGSLAVVTIALLAISNWLNKISPRR
jgi:hypothetical protein